MNRQLPGIIAFGLILTLMGCSSPMSTMQSESNDLKAKAVEPAPDAGFIEKPGQQTRRADLPFQKVWIKPGFEKYAYRILVVAPVNTQYMLEMDWLQKAGTTNWVGDVKKDIRELARYFHAQVVKNFKEDPKHRFQVTENPGPYQQPALRLELALIEIAPSEPVLHALGRLVPGGGTAAGVVNKRTAAFEGRLRDIQTGEVVATFADRDMLDMSPTDLTRLTWYGPVGRTVRPDRQPQARRGSDRPSCLHAAAFLGNPNRAAGHEYMNGECGRG